MGTANRIQVPVELVASVAHLREKIGATSPRLVILDLGTRELSSLGFVAELKQVDPSLKFVAYGPHVQLDRLQAAHAAGCDEVLSRGQFNQECGGILKRYAGRDF